LSLLANEMFSRAGRNVQIVKLPGERALLNANAGIDDGELFRVGGMEKKYPNLVKVPEAMMTFDFVAFTKPEKAFPVMDWTSLEPYIVGIINGWKIYETNVTGVAERKEVRDMELLFKLLKNDRADVVMADRWQGMYISKRLSISADVVEPPFATRKMFMYLHKKHARLVSKLASALVAIKQDGAYSRMYASTLKKLTE